MDKMKYYTLMCKRLVFDEEHKKIIQKHLMTIKLRES